MTDSLQYFPIELLTEIFTYLEPRHRKKCALVCRQWKLALETKGFYHSFVFRDVMEVNEEKLEVFQQSYHPFKTLHFLNVRQFFINDLFRQFCSEVKKINEIKFTNCQSLDDVQLTKILQELFITKIKIVGINSLSGLKLKHKYDAVKSLHLDEGFFTKKNLTAFIKSFPNLEFLSLRCDEFNSNLDWIRNLTRWIPKISLSCIFVDHLIPEGIINQIVGFQGVEIYHWDSLLKDISPDLLRSLLTKLSGSLQKLTVQDAGSIPIQYFQTISKLCADLKELRLVFASNCEPNVLEHISDMQSLEVLEVKFELKPTNPVSLTSRTLNLSKLVSFKINVIPENFHLVIQSFPNLRHLSISRSSLDSETLSLIFKVCTRLNSFSIFNVKAPLESCPEFFELEHLESLAIEYCDFSKELLRKLKSSRLHDLTFTSSKTITTDEIHVLAKNCPNLGRLAIFRCSEVSDDAVEVLMTGFPQLEFLNIEKTGITEEGYRTLKNKIKEVQIDDVEFYLDSLHGLKFRSF